MRLIATLIISCFFSTPVFSNDDSTLDAQLRSAAILQVDETLLLNSHVYFYAGKKGYSLLSSGKPRVKAQIVFTENGFHVVSFKKKSKRFQVLYSLQYAQLASVDIAGNSPLVRLVTERKNEDHFDSFELMDTRNAFTPSSTKTIEAKKLISAGIQGLDVKTVATAPSLSSVQMTQQKNRIEVLEQRVQQLEQRLDELATHLK
jgi:hypothetical protein|tara:strand:- start:21085 stop:21693 length:609 start_codon:yes stop_codon:yes gene_type:complete